MAEGNLSVLLYLDLVLQGSRIHTAVGWQRGGRSVELQAQTNVLQQRSENKNNTKNLVYTDVFHSVLD